MQLRPADARPRLASLVTSRTATREPLRAAPPLRHVLANAGVPRRTAQVATRQSDPSITANVYNDPKLLEVADAVTSLPDLPLDR
jgi:hypothetical protein